MGGCFVKACDKLASDITWANKVFEYTDQRVYLNKTSINFKIFVFAHDMSSLDFSV